MTITKHGLPILPMFYDTADEMFTEAGVDPGQFKAARETVAIMLAEKMEDLSRDVGLAYERVDLYEEYKKSLQGTIRPIAHLLRKFDS